MKVKLVQAIIAIAVSLLFTYGFYSFHHSENKILLCSGGFVSLTVTLICAIGIRFERARTSTNFRVVSGIFFAIALILNSVFTFLHFSVPSYIIINGIMLLVFISITYSISISEQ